MARRTQQRIYRELRQKFDRQVARAFVEAIRDAITQPTLSEIRAAIETGNPLSVLRALGLDDDSAYFSLAEKLREGYVEGGVNVAEELPRAVRFRFDGDHERARRWLREKSETLETVFRREIADSIRQVIDDGLSVGRGSDRIARDLVGRVNRRTGLREGGVIGLSDQQTKYALNMKRELENLDSRYFSRKLRNRNFDGQVRRAIEEGRPLSQAKRDEIERAYRNRMMQKRGELVAQTQGREAIQTGRKEAYEQLKEKGRVKEISKRWQWNDGAQDPREDHQAMANAPARPMDEPFRFPDGAEMDYPNDPNGPIAHKANCHCTIIYRVEV